MYKLQLLWDEQIAPGTIFEVEIGNAILDADVVICLISESSIKSKYIQNKEVKASLIRREESNIGILGILLDKCNYRDSYFKNIQIIPSQNGRLKPIIDWEDKRQCWSYIKQAVEIAIHNSLAGNPVLQYTSTLKSIEIEDTVLKQFLPVKRYSCCIKR